MIIMSCYLTIFEYKRITIMPILATITLIPSCVVQTLDTNACALITRIKVIHVNVAVALAWQAFAIWYGRITVVTRSTPLTELASIAGLTLAVIDLVCVLIKFTRVGKHVRLHRSGTCAQATLSETGSIIDLIVALLAELATVTISVVSTVDTFACILVAFVRMTVTCARHTVK
jgi:hypothetical protein